MVFLAEEICADFASEALFIGCLYKKPILFVDYADLIKSKYDFADDVTKFFMIRLRFTIKHFHKK